MVDEPWMKIKGPTLVDLIFGNPDFPVTPVIMRLPLHDDPRKLRATILDPHVLL